MFRIVEKGRAGAGARGRVPDDLALHTLGLTKHYRHPWTLGVTRGLTGLDLDVRRGEVFGYLGPNGAGKTTTIKLLTGLLRPTGGAGWVLGEPIGTERSRRRIGFLPEQPYFYDSLTGEEYLELAGRLSGLAAHEATVRAREWMGRVSLSPRPRLPLRKYSKGMLQRLGLAAALLHGPELLFLDEPMSGLDPLGRRDVRELILDQRARGVSVMLSSHILPDVETLCDRVGVVMGGQLVRTGTVNDLVASRRQRVEIRCVGAPLLELPAGWRERITRHELPEGTTFVLGDERDLNDVLAWLIQGRATLRAVTPQRSSLEDFFLDVAEARGEAGGSERSA